MFKTANRSFNAKCKHLNFIYLFVYFFLFSFCIPAAAEESLPNESLSPAAQRVIEQFQKIDEELGMHGGSISEMLLEGSYYQDAWLGFLHDAENTHEYYRGMGRLAEHTSLFKSMCRYAATAIDFYTGDARYPSPQRETIFHDDQNVLGFLNTFKKGFNLLDEQREQLFQQELSTYLEVHDPSQPFTLDPSTIESLEQERMYSFVLFPDGLIRAAKEQPEKQRFPAENEEDAEGLISHSIHTILSEHPHQAMVTAGGFVLYKVEDKCLFFISCKSGHFQPTYESLAYMKNQLSRLGVDPCTIIEVPDVDLTNLVLKVDNKAQIPVCITEKDTQRLFELALQRWECHYQEMDRNLLDQFASGNAVELEQEMIDHLMTLSEEAGCMCCAYRLFCADHTSPPTFHKLASYLKKLKDGIKDQFILPMQAARLIDLMDQYEAERDWYNHTPANDASFYDFLSANINCMKEMLSKESLLIDEYLCLDQLTGEITALFFYLSYDVKWKGKGFFIYRTAAETFSQMNESIARMHNAYAENRTNEELASKEVAVQLPSNIAQKLSDFLEHIGLAPPQFAIEIIPEDAWWMINLAKDWFQSHDTHLNPHYSTPKEKEESLVPFLRAVFNGEYDPHDINNAERLTLFEMLQKHAEIARSALIFLDASHQTPCAVHDYIKAVRNIVQVLKENNVEKATQEAGYLFAVCYQEHPGSRLNEWECTDQDSFEATLKAYLEGLHELQEENCLLHDRAKEIIEQLQAIQGLMNLFRRNSLSKKHYQLHEKLPSVCYESIEEHARDLVKILREILKDNPEKFTTTPQMVFHASFILSRLDSSQDAFDEY